MKKRSYISLFSSAGIGCYGFKKAGFTCLATNEYLEQRINIQKINSKCENLEGYIQGDIRDDKNKGKIINIVKEYEKKTNQSVDVVIATPPCQGMSTANYKKKDELEKNSLVVEAVNMVKKIKPKIFIFENVRAFLNSICTNNEGVNVKISEMIENELSGEYFIYKKIINFKEYGVPSSRPRTIVVGTLKSIVNISPLNIFPLKEKEISLKDSIGDLESLSKMGSFSKNDFLHFFRPYPEYMREWISDLGEGESSFNNEEKKIPYKITKNGDKVKLKSAHLGNKFRRLFWNKHGACVATRNDQLASQDTIHPSDDRVLSIRELMRIMSIPDDFKWYDKDVIEINLMSFAEKRKFLKTIELNIRRVIGESVPTKIMYKMAENINEMLDFNDFVEKFYKEKKIPTNLNVENYYIKSFVTEKNLTNNKDSGSYYTNQSTVFKSICDLNIKKKEIEILEPSVGMGAFIPQLLRLVDESEIINLYLCDINSDIIKDLKKNIDNQRYNEKFIFHYICSDIMEIKDRKYDLIIGNPPYFKVDKIKKKKYSLIANTSNRISNIYGFIMAKFFDKADNIIFIIPKTFIMAPEFNEIKTKYQNYGIVKIIDFGVYAFKEVFIETITIHFNKKYNKLLKVESYLSDEIIFHQQKKIFYNNLWLIYRNEWFDKYLNNLELDIFKEYRDRKITNKILKDSGNIWVVKSKNILSDGTVKHIEGYDKYIDDIKGLGMDKFFNKKIIIVPNFTYNIRASILPDNSIANGSVVFLTSKKELIDKKLSYFSSDSYRKYYSIVKNKSKFTLNIDSNTIKYIGILKNKGVK